MNARLPLFLLTFGQTCLGISITLFFGGLGLLIYIAGFSAGSISLLILQKIREDEREEIPQWVRDAFFDEEQSK